MGNNKTVNVINDFNPISSNVDVSFDPNVEDPINISHDVQNDN